MSLIRPPAVAGSFYPADAISLSTQVRAFLGEARFGAPEEDFNTPPKALIAPHAGYIYSGPIAAHAYAHIQSLKDTVERVVLLGPCHRVAVQGLRCRVPRLFRPP